MEKDFHIRPLTTMDVAAGMRLKRQAGWNQTEGDWHRFLRLSPEGSYAGCVGGKVVATVTTVRFGEVGWIGMVLVEPEHRGRGFGKTMLRYAIGYLQDRVETIKLDATELGRPLYEKLGFRVEYGVTRYEYHPAQRRTESLTEESTIDVARVFELDRRIYGCDRSVLLRRLREEQLPIMLADGNEGVEGYGTIRPGENAQHFGPAVAQTERASSEIIAWVRRRVVGACFMDVPNVSGYRVRMIDELGLIPQRGFVRMVLGPKAFSGDPGKVLATSGAEKG